MSTYVKPCAKCGPQFWPWNRPCREDAYTNTIHCPVCDRNDRRSRKWQQKQYFIDEWNAKNKGGQP